jgi:hypothetical protein
VSADIYIVVEGTTEQTFIRDVLAPEMAVQEIYLYPVLIGKPGHKGGDIRFDRAENDIGNFLKQRKDTYISTMFDFFRIDADWPGKKEVIRQIKSGSVLSAVRKAEILESATRKKIGENFGDSVSRFIPYIEMHEFEALLFSDADILAEKAEIDISHLRGILEEYNNEPEEINDNPEKAPSKRLEALNRAYRKVAMGKTVSEAIGIQTIREQCPHFDKWLTELEGLKGRS